MIVFDDRFKMKHDYQLNLQCLSIIRIAITIWEQQLVSLKSSVNFYDSENVKDLCMRVLKQTEQIVLPNSLKTKLLYAVESIGWKIHFWILHIADTFELTLNLAQQTIYWTYYGKIDELKIFKLVWLKDPNLDITLVFEMACHYCLEEHIIYLWEMISCDNEYNYFKDSNNNCNKHLMMYWQCYFKSDFTKLTTQITSFLQYGIYDSNNFVNQNMFRLSIFQGYEAAVPYFWGRLTEEEKTRNLLQYNNLVTPNFIIMENQVYNMEVEASGHIFMFIFRKMSETERVKLIQTAKYNILGVFLNVWPWNEFLMTIFEQMFSYFDSDDCEWLLEQIKSFINIDRRSGIKLEQLQFHRMLRYIRKKFPKVFKQHLYLNDSFWYKKSLN